MSLLSATHSQHSIMLRRVPDVVVEEEDDGETDARGEFGAFKVLASNGLISQLMSLKVMSSMAMSLL